MENWLYLHLLSIILFRIIVLLSGLSLQSTSLLKFQVIYLYYFFPNKNKMYSEFKDGASRA